MPKSTHALLRSTSAFLAMLLIASLGCKDTISPASPPTGALAPVRSVAPALHDAGMSDLSPVAQHIIVALRDSAVRVAVIDALKQSTNGHIGIDLSSCNGISLGAAIISTGERLGAGPASPICDRLRTGSGMTLYMSPERLARWNPTVIPIVTAIANPDQPRPVHIMGYQFADMTIDISDPKFIGPVLVVVPYAHGSHLTRRTIGTKTEFGLAQVTRPTPVTAKP